MPDEKLRAVTLFPNRGAGFGYGVTRDPEAPEGYDSAVNMRVSADGRMLAPTYYPNDGQAIRSTAAPGFIVPYSYGGQSYALLGVKLGAVGQIYKYINKAVATESGPAELLGGWAFWDDGSGNPCLYVGERGANKYLWRRRMDTEVWSSSTVVGQFLCQTGSHLWASVNDYQLKNCPAGTNPFTGTWSALIQCGSSAVPLNAIGAIGGSVVVGKADGLYFYREDLDQFRNEYVMPFNPDNFTFFEPDGQGGLLTATATGEVVRITKFGSIITLSPLRGKPVGRDTPRGPIVHAISHGDKIYALMPGNYRRTMQGTLKVFKVTAGPVYTDLTANVTDGKYSTSGAIGGLTSSDYLLIGFQYPFVAVNFLMGSLNAVATYFAAYLSDGAGGFAADLGADGGFTDGTCATVNLGARQTCLGQSGMIAIRDNNGDGSWGAQTINGVNAYWLKLVPQATLTNPCTILELSIVNRRSAPAWPLPSVPSFEDPASRSRWEHSGAYPHILIGQIVGDGIVWQDALSVSYIGTSGGRLAVTTIPTPETPQLSLLALVDEELVQWPLTWADEPGRVDFASFSGADHFFRPSAVDLGPGYWETVALEVEVANGDNARVAGSLRWDDTVGWTGPELVPVSDGHFYQTFDRESNAGRVLSTEVQLCYPTAGVVQTMPWIRRITAYLRERPELEAGKVPAPARTTPEAS